MNVYDFEKILADVTFEDWRFEVHVDVYGRGHVYLQIVAPNGACNETGEPWAWKSRKWFLSPHMTRSEVVQTALKAVLTALEHEAREKFLYRSRAIFGPHFDVDRLWEMTCRDDALDKRKPIHCHHAWEFTDQIKNQNRWTCAKCQATLEVNY